MQLCAPRAISARPDCTRSSVATGSVESLSGPTPSRRARSRTSRPTASSPNCGMRAARYGRARPACSSTWPSQCVVSLKPTPERSGGMRPSSPMSTRSSLATK